jgi:ribose transport system permease protein
VSRSTRRTQSGDALGEIATQRTTETPAVSPEEIGGEGASVIPASLTMQAPDPDESGRRSFWGVVGNESKRLSLPILTVISFAIYALWPKTSSVFLSAADFRNILASQAVIGVLTLGILVTMVCGNFDLSVGNIAGLSAIMTADIYANHHVPMLVGVIIGIGIGALVGGINGLLVTVLRVDPFIITLGTASAILGFIDWFTKDVAIVNGIPDSLINFGSNNFLGIPDIAWVLIAAALAIYYLLEHTPYGRNLHAIGSNRAAARLVGIRVERSIALAFVITGAFAGVSGVLLLAHTGAGNPQISPTLALTALASAFLGAASFKVGRLNVPGTIVAIFFLAINITGLTFAGVQNWINEVFTGLTLIFAIAIAAILSKERKTKRQTAPANDQTGQPA